MPLLHWTVLSPHQLHRVLTVNASSETYYCFVFSLLFTTFVFLAHCGRLSFLSAFECTTNILCCIIIIVPLAWCRSSYKAWWCTMHLEWRNATVSPAIRQRSPNCLLCREVSTWELDRSGEVRGAGAASAGSPRSPDPRRCRRLCYAQVWSVIVSICIRITPTSDGSIRFRRWRNENWWPTISVCFALKWQSVEPNRLRFSSL